MNSEYSWNVRSVKHESTRLVMAIEMNCYQADVRCLSETRLNGVSEETIPVRDSDNSYLFLDSGAHDGSGDHGVGFMIGLRAQKALLAWDPVSPRIARLRLKGRLSNISIITVYAPTRVATDADKDSFYSDLEITMQKCPKRDFLILAGDWNSRVGPTDPNVCDIFGPFTHTASGAPMVIDYSSSRDLITFSSPTQCSNTKPSQRITWRSNDGSTAAQIDHILIRQRWRSSVIDS